VFSNLAHFFNQIYDVRATRARARARTHTHIHSLYYIHHIGETENYNFALLYV